MMRKSPSPSFTWRELAWRCAYGLAFGIAAALAWSLTMTLLCAVFGMRDPD